MCGGGMNGIWHGGGIGGGIIGGGGIWSNGIYGGAWSGLGWHCRPPSRPESWPD